MTYMYIHCCIALLVCYTSQTLQIDMQVQTKGATCLIMWVIANIPIFILHSSGIGRVTELDVRVRL